MSFSEKRLNKGQINPQWTTDNGKRIVSYHERKTELYPNKFK